MNPVNIYKKMDANATGNDECYEYLAFNVPDIEIEHIEEIFLETGMCT